MHSVSLEVLVEFKNAINDYARCLVNQTSYRNVGSINDIHKEYINKSVEEMKLRGVPITLAKRISKNTLGVILNNTINDINKY